MFRPRPNATGSSSKDGAGSGIQAEGSTSSLVTEGGVVEPTASLPTGAGEESFISKMMADK